MEPNLGYIEALAGHTSNPKDPREGGYPLLIGDEDLTVSTCELRIKAQFEQWVRKGSLAAATDAENMGNRFEADRIRSLYMKEFGLGWYSWGPKGVKIDAAKYTGSGYTYLLYLLLRRCHPQITEDKVDKLIELNTEECRKAVDWALGNSPAPKVNQPEGQPTTLASV